MTEEKKKHDDKECEKVSDEELKDVAGGTDGKKGLNAVNVKVV